MPAAALIGGVASLAGTALSQFGADERAEQAFGRQKELMALQNQYAVQNWARENRYNTPEEQRKRLQAAGLNPDLMYGSGGVGNQAGSIDAPGAPSAPMAPAMDYSKSVDSAVQAAVGMANAKKAKSEGMAQEIHNQYLAEEITANIRNTNAAAGVSEQSSKNLEAEYNNIGLQGSILVAQLDQIRENITASKWHRLCERMATISDLFVKEADIQLKEGQFDQIRQLTPALVAQAFSAAGLSAAYSKIAGIVGDPEKAIKLFDAWVTAIGDKISSLFSGDDNGEYGDPVTLKKLVKLFGPKKKKGKKVARYINGKTVYVNVE